ncbi:helix-turn-helix transcriptional regulator [Chitinophaga agrisoli]|uniref:Helix-turn-helix transcriptional regulator n=1 Tax=Chitinophaga agrisoli TaxID=2607653 RepID=A0A5B2VLK0_9BACT|nr:helix-turn-helix transcriptional regulator [Chitinophaga agrisoli]KAA2239520.1 helix-turn-helix transcriptional regulator [Chitinophaga agrisoli]
MEKTENIEEFYRRKLNWMPDNLKREIGHFNVFRMKEFVGPNAAPAPFSRKDFYKITLVKGRNRYFYADKTVEIADAALLFSNPMIPYKCEHLDEQQDGCFCIFTEAFFSQFGNIREYPVFQPGTSPFFSLKGEELKEVQAIFERLFAEIKTEYAFKYDLIRALVLELIHKAMRMTPVDTTFFTDSNANTRIASLFVELLERQFPIESPQQKMQLRTPADFATHLSVHINHLNRSLKSVTGHTTSGLIAERIIQEARILLKHTDWNVAEVGYCLGFEEPSHFIAFFKKNMQQTPNAFRK